MDQKKYFPDENDPEVLKKLAELKAEMKAKHGNKTWQEYQLELDEENYRKGVELSNDPELKAMQDEADKAADAEGEDPEVLRRDKEYEARRRALGITPPDPALWSSDDYDL